MIKMTLDKEGIKKIMPHRDPMLLIEEVSMTDEGEAIGTYRVRGDEFFVQGHFPGAPVVPGVILCEMMAQTACIIFADKPGWTPLYTSLNNVKFRNPVKPGDTVTMICKHLKSKSVFHFMSGTVKVGDKVCTTAEFSFALLEPEAKERL